MIPRLICAVIGHRRQGGYSRRSGNRVYVTYLCDRCNRAVTISYLDKP